ncbi:hypothetical protein LCGC14_2604870 [marine sediment metagenome]|uniref:N-acetyltransferase domain-containing protein n=1 Tax=marine sediment metagenome TaxID=412755 RepID=A0A0F9A7K6_9ZZZZ
MELRKPTTAFIEQAKVWHEDDEVNHWTGFGRGEPARQLAAKALDQVLEVQPSPIRFFAIWDDSEPLGYVVFTDLDDHNHTAEIHITLGPEHQGQGYGPQALKKAVTLGFLLGLYRITYKPVLANKRAIQAGYKAGFKLEAKTKFSVWTIDGPQDQAQMRVIKPEWPTKD